MSHKSFQSVSVRVRVGVRVSASVSSSVSASVSASVSVSVSVSVSPSVRVTREKRESLRYADIWAFKLQVVVVLYPTSIRADKIFCFAEIHLGVPPKNWLYLVIRPKSDTKEKTTESVH